MNKKFHFLVALFFLSSEQSHTSNGRIAQSILRTGRAFSMYAGRKAVEKIKEHPQESAGAAVGGYIGFKAAGGSKLHGALGGAIVGVCLVRQRRDVRTIAIQVQEALAYARQAETHIIVETAAQQEVLKEMYQQNHGLQKRMFALQRTAEKIRSDLDILRSKYSQGQSATSMAITKQEPHTTEQKIGRVSAWYTKLKMNLLSKQRSNAVEEGRTVLLMP